jgi:uncharacterized RDD family membrane protein YckC
VGILLLVAGIRDQTSQLVTLVEGDIEGGFFPWLLAIFLVGSLGYSQKLQTFSRVFMGLIVISLVIANKGIFAQLQSNLSTAATGTAPSNSSTVVGANPQTNLQILGATQSVNQAASLGASQQDLLQMATALLQPQN